LYPSKNELSLTRFFDPTMQCHGLYLEEDYLTNLNTHYGRVCTGICRGILPFNVIYPG
jgi:hypothetical protein